MIGEVKRSKKMINQDAKEGDKDAQYVRVC